MFTVSHSFNRLNPVNLVQFMLDTHDLMSALPIFATPTTSYADYETLRKKLATDITNANGGDAGMIIERNNTFQLAKTMTLDFANYVQLVSKGNQGIINSSGFKANSKTKNNGPFITPIIDKVSNYGKNVLLVKIQQNADKGRIRTRVLRYKQRGAATWEKEINCSTLRNIVPNLLSGIEYVFETQNYGAGGRISDVSNGGSCFCT